MPYPRKLTDLSNRHGDTTGRPVRLKLDRAGNSMPRPPGLPLALRCRHLADQALALTRTGQHDRALEALLTAEAMGPDWIKPQVFPRRIVTELLAVDRQSRLREFARRLDVLG